MAPQHQTLPPRAIAQLCDNPAAIAVNRKSIATTDGDADRVVPPFPNCPRSLAPQQNTFPSALTKHVCMPPAITVTRAPAEGAAGSIVGVGAGGATGCGVCGEAVLFAGVGTACCLAPFDTGAWRLASDESATALLSRSGLSSAGVSWSGAGGSLFGEATAMVGPIACTECSR